MRPDSWTPESANRVTSFLWWLLSGPLACELRRRQIAPRGMDPLLLIDLVPEPPELRGRSREVPEFGQAHAFLFNGPPQALGVPVLGRCPPVARRICTPAASRCAP